MKENPDGKKSLYRKPTFSGVFTQYESYLDQSIRTFNNKNQSLIYALLFRSFSICSDYTLLQLEFEHLREILRNNSYLSEMTEQSIKSFLNKLYVPRKLMSSIAEKKVFIILPYLETISSNLKQKLRNCLKNSLPQCNIKIILESTKRLSSI